MRKYIFKNKKLFIINVLFIILASILSVLFAFILKYILDLAVQGDLKLFLKGIIILLLFCLVSFIVDAVSVYIKSIYVKQIIISIRQEILNSLLKKNIKKFNEKNSAQYISILSNDITMLENDGIANIFNLILYLSSFILALISSLYINIGITIIIFILGVFVAVIPQLFVKIISNKRKFYSECLERLSTITKEIFSGFEVIKNFNIQNKIKELYLKNNIETENKKQEFSIASGLLETISSILGLLMFCIPIGLGGYNVVNGIMTVGSMMAMVQLMNNIVRPLTSSTQIIGKIKSLNSIIDKIDEITKQDCTEKITESLKSFDNCIEMKNVSFSYDGKNKILKNINLKFEKGKKYAIVGASGSGKSTILKLLLKYYDYYDGNIYIDNKIFKNISEGDLYKQITSISQNVFTFDGTIKDNIGLYNEYSENEIVNAARMAGLSDLLDNFKEGIYGYVGENGAKLSGGEKQRLAIARALIRKSSIMFLDESTSSLDSKTSYSIENAILSFTKMTVIVVTHKFNKDILSKYDEIISIKDGAVVEKGKFEELIKAKGYFYSLYMVT